MVESNGDTGIPKSGLSQSSVVSDAALLQLTGDRNVWWNTSGKESTPDTGMSVMPIRLSPPGESATMYDDVWLPFVVILNSSFDKMVMDAEESEAYRLIWDIAQMNVKMERGKIQLFINACGLMMSIHFPYVVF